MPSFDIASKVEWHEIDNALQQTKKEVAQRFDFKGTGAELKRNSEGITLTANGEDRVKAMLEVLKEKMVKRKVSLKHLDPGDINSSLGGFRQLIKVQEGIDTDHARKIVKFIKDEKMKVTASIQESQVRVSGKKRDDLQTCIKALKEREFDIELQFTNFRE